MSEHPDILIIGGGVIGLSCAYYLAREGVRVTVVDRGDFGREASWAGAGILPPGNPARATDVVGRFLALGSSLHETLALDLRDRTGIENGYIRSGGVEVLRDEGYGFPEVRREGITCRLFDAEALHDIEPALAPTVRTGCYLPDMAQVRNPWHLKALIAACAGLGVRLCPSCPVDNWIMRGDKVDGVGTGEGDRHADEYLLASGAWTDGMLEPLGIRLDVRPVRGQIALLNTGAPLLRRIVLEGKRYIVPRQDGRVLVGSTEEDAGFDHRTTAKAIAELLQFAVRLVPALAGATVERTWAGLRPGSPDELPFLGRVPGWENVSVAAGHFRAGIQLSPITGMLMKELLLGQTLTVPLDRFGVTRMANRERERPV
jgi:glycine oxidase